MRNKLDYIFLMLIFFLVIKRFLLGIDDLIIIDLIIFFVIILYVFIFRKNKTKV